VRTENAIQQTMQRHSRVKEKFMKRLILTGLLATSFAAADLISPAAYAGDNEQYVPLPTYRATRPPERFGGPARSTISATSTKSKVASTA
jgi:maltose-binding protein MalE